MGSKWDIVGNFEMVSKQGLVIWPKQLPHLLFIGSTSAISLPVLTIGAGANLAKFLERQQRIPAVRNQAIQQIDFIDRSGAGCELKDLHIVNPVLVDDRATELVSACWQGGQYRMHVYPVKNNSGKIFQ